jgi:hypothetical protein
MAKENLRDQTTEDLIKKKKNTNFVIGMFLGALAMAIFLTIKDGLSFLLFIPLAFLPILYINYNMGKNINKELKSRNSN